MERMREEWRTGIKMRDIKKKSAGQMTRLERFVHTMEEQDDATFLMKKVVKWMCFFPSVFCLGFLTVEWTSITVVMGIDAFFMGMLSMLYTLDSPVVMRRAVTRNLYECLKYFPVGRLEIYRFLRKRLLHFLGVYGGLAVSLRIIIGAMTDSFGLESLIFPLLIWILLALVGFSVIRVRLAWRYRKKVRSL